MFTRLAGIMAIGGGAWGIGLSVTWWLRLSDAFPFLVLLLLICTIVIAVALWHEIKPMWRASVWCGRGPTAERFSDLGGDNLVRDRRYPGRCNVYIMFQYRPSSDSLHCAIYPSGDTCFGAVATVTRAVLINCPGSWLYIVTNRFLRLSPGF